MNTSDRLDVIGGAAGAAALGASAVGATAKAVTGRFVDPDTIGDYGRIYRERASIVVADDGTPLCVRESGDLDAPLTIVYVNGYCQRMSVWHHRVTTSCPALDELDVSADDGAESEHLPMPGTTPPADPGPVRHVFYDQRGHGISATSSPDKYRIAVLASDLAAVIRAVVPTGPVIVVGQAMGASVTLAMAGAHPDMIGDRVAGAVLCSPFVSGRRATENGQVLSSAPAELLRFALRTLPSGVTAAAAPLTANVVASHLGAMSLAHPADRPELVRFVESMIAATPTETLLALTAELAAYEDRSGFAELSRVPTVVLGGYEDRVNPLSEVVDSASALGGRCELIGVRDAGHLLPLETPEAVDDAIGRVVDRVNRDRR